MKFLFNNPRKHFPIYKKICILHNFVCTFEYNWTLMIVCHTSNLLLLEFYYQSNPFMWEKRSCFLSNNILTKHFFQFYQRYTYCRTYIKNYFCWRKVIMKESCCEIDFAQVGFLILSLSKNKSRSHRDLNSDRWIQSPEC